MTGFARSFGALTLLAALMLVARAPEPPMAHGDAGAAEDRYLVVLRNSPGAATAERISAELGIDTLADYSEAIRGFSAVVPPESLAALRNNPDVLLVEPDGIMRAAIHENPFQTLPTGANRIDADVYPGAGIGGSAGPDIGGDVAVIDSGIDVDHADLNVAGGTRFTGPACTGGSFDDDHFHGTHVAGIIAARDDDRGVVGVAPGARLWAIKVLDSTGIGYTSCVVAGIDWATGRKREFNDGPADGDAGINLLVLNASLGGPVSGTLCFAINGAVAQGIMVATAAGNDLADAATSGPGNCSRGVTTSAYADFDGLPAGQTDLTVTYDDCTESEDDSFACFSNFGSVVDIIAPGVEIISTVPNGLYGIAGGTSMAAPHVAGALLLHRLQAGYSGPADGPVVTSALISAGWTQPQGSTCGMTGDPDTTREPMLYLGTNCFGDRDSDGVLDQADTCPDWANAGGTMPPWSVPAGDTDCDGFTRGHEAHGYYLASRRCPATTSANDEDYDAWPTDNDDNRLTTLTDVIRFSPSYNTNEGDASFNPRFDINADGGVNLADIVRFAPFFNKSCS